MKFYFSSTEIKEILIAAAVLSVTFAIAFSDGIAGLAQSNFENFPLLIVFSFVAVGAGFLAHELIGHKFFAQKYDLHAEFRLWRLGLVLAFATSLIGAVFAAPGAVYVGQKLDVWGNPTSDASRKKMGVISVMGPIVNVIVGLLFLALSFLYPLSIPGIGSNIWILGAWMNVWLAFFNMLPIPPLDGSKVLAWDRRIFAVLFVPLLAAVILFLV